MSKAGSVIIAGLMLAFSSQQALADWHHHSGSSGVPPDPHMEACVVTVAVSLASTLVILFLGGPLLIIWGRRILHTLWLLPLANLLLYLVSISLQPYPGGFGARFETPGLFYTLAEIVFVLVASMIVALIVMAIQWLLRKLRPVPGKRPTSLNPQ